MHYRYFRHSTKGLSPLANVQLAKVLLARFGNPRAKDLLRVADCNQDFVAPAPYHMPIEVVSVRVRGRAPAFKESAFWNCVLDSSRYRYSRHSEGEWENERIRGRPKASLETQWNQGKDEQTNYSRVRGNNENWTLSHFSWQGQNDFAV